MTSRALLAALALGGCGYHSVYAAPSGKMSVRKVVSVVADNLVALEVEEGVREALAREDALATGNACPCITVEVTRIDHGSGAIVAAGGNPHAAGQVTAVVGRATAVDDRGTTLFDTGDARAEATYVDGSAVGGTSLGNDGSAVGGTSLSELVRGQDVTKSAGRRLGRMLGARLLGHPSASEETEGP